MFNRLFKARAEAEAKAEAERQAVIELRADICSPLYNEDEALSEKLQANHILGMFCLLINKVDKQEQRIKELELSNKAK